MTWQRTRKTLDELPGHVGKENKAEKTSCNKAKLKTHTTNREDVCDGQEQKQTSQN